MSFKYKALLIIAPVVFILDQLTKWLVVKYIPLNGGISVIPGYFDLVHFQNKGAAFGMLAAAGEQFRLYFFYVIALVALIILITFFVRFSKETRLLPVAISLVFGGMAGNTLDRIRLGAVTDFLSLHIRDAAIDWKFLGWRLHIPLDWPAFNVADSAITIAMFFLIIAAFRKERRMT